MPRASLSSSINPDSISKVMLNVGIALIPGTLAMTYFFGWGILLNIIIAITFALAAEALVLRLRSRSVKPTLLDNSAVISAWLFALTLPPLAPWWLTALGICFAIIFAKQLFGGLGHNPFNPAMIGYVIVLISFPKEMTQWLNPHHFMDTPLSLSETLSIMLLGQAPSAGWDSITSATPLDIMHTQLARMETIDEIRSSAIFGDFGGRGWEWIANWYALGGFWLLYKRIITWHIPVSVIATVILSASLFYIFDPDSQPSPGFHIFSGGLMLGAFFIATDPVTACSSRKGKIFFGAGIGLLTYIIRTWGGYPDGVAFAVLLMNMAAPFIDQYTRPKVYGQTKHND